MDYWKGEAKHRLGLYLEALDEMRRLNKENIKLRHQYQPAYGEPD